MRTGHTKLVCGCIFRWTENVVMPPCKETEEKLNKWVKELSETKYWTHGEGCPIRTKLLEECK